MLKLDRINIWELVGIFLTSAIGAIIGVWGIYLANTYFPGIIPKS